MPATPRHGVDEADETQQPITDEQVIPEASAGKDQLEEITDTDSGATDELGSADAAATKQDMLDLRRAAAQYGLDLSKYEDDDSALKALVDGTRRAQAMEQLSPYVQDYLQN